MHDNLTIEGCISWLKARGWSVGDLAVLEDGRKVWVVSVHNEQRGLVARAPSQFRAWRKAVVMAGEDAPDRPEEPR